MLLETPNLSSSHAAVMYAEAAYFTARSKFYTHTNCTVTYCNVIYCRQNTIISIIYNFCVILN